MGRTAKVRVLAGTFGAALAATAVAGCGSNTETSSIVSAPTKSSGATTSKSAFVRQADAICAEANSAINALPATGSAPSGSVTVSQELATVKGELQGLKSLGTPDSGGPQLERYLAALQDQLTALQHEAKAIQSGTSGTASTEVESATSAAQAAARAFGLRACAGSATPAGSASASAATSGAGAGAGAATSAATPTATAPAAPATTPTAVTPVTPTTATPAPAPAPVPSGGTGTSTAGSGGSGGTGGVGVGGGSP